MGLTDSEDWRDENQSEIPDTGDVRGLEASESRVKCISTLVLSYPSSSNI